MSRISARHAGHEHTVNIKYGYLVLFLSVVHASLLVWSSYASIKNWRRNGKPSRRNSQLLPTSIIISIWAVLIAVISVWYVDLPENYSVTIKRLGRISYALIPFDIFLVLRPSSQGGIFNYLTTMNLHKWLSRLIIVLSLLHGIGFTVKWIIEGTLIEKTLKWDNLLGAIAWWFVLVLLVVSSKVVRSRIYKWFYVYHNLTAWIFVVAIGFHARPGVFLYACSCLGLFAFQIWLRFSQSIKIEVENLEVISDPHSSLQVVRMPKIYFPPWSPTSHIRISMNLNILETYLFPSHPYTIASTIDDEYCDLIVKKTNNVDFIRNKQQNSTGSYTVVGPFPSLPEPFFITSESVSIICGGSGISFGLPILKGINSNAEINLFWCIRNRSDLHILKALKFDEKITVFITDQSEYSDGIEGTNEDEAQMGLLDQEEQDDASQNPIELDDFSSNKSQVEDDTKNITIKQGRPVFDEIFHGLNTSSDKNNKWLIACGPQGLIEASKKWCGENDVPLLSELYEF
ncbi:probable metalloreductase Aim14p [[Candida] railenensis]|uniref:Probable metalloreductase AIM14 n=1 Tax=[Candida] railenensis TaxID=45579 RepID=A0A9P0QKM8_9ASCO|nr:probable metalloreductase Aim14p [[Candida] railenensis]